MNGKNYMKRNMNKHMKKAVVCWEHHLSRDNDDAPLQFVWFSLQGTGGTMGMRAKPLEYVCVRAAA